MRHAECLVDSQLWELVYHNALHPGVLEGMPSILLDWSKWLETVTLLWTCPTQYLIPFHGTNQMAVSLHPAGAAWAAGFLQQCFDEASWVVQGRVVTSRETSEDFCQLARTPSATTILGGGVFCLSRRNKAEQKEWQHREYQTICPEAHFPSSFTSSLWWRWVGEGSR